jgi:hypothetical protein
MGHLNGCRYLSHDREGLNWIWPFGKGRLFSSAMGHTPTLFSTTALAEYMLAGIQYVLRPGRGRHSQREAGCKEVSGYESPKLCQNSRARGQLRGAYRGAVRKLKIGYTCVLWGSFPGGPERDATLEPAVRVISKLGFYWFETFPEILEHWDEQGKLRKLIDEYQQPLKSGYIGTNLTDSTQRKGNLAKVICLAR